MPCSREGPGSHTQLSSAVRPLGWGGKGCWFEPVTTQIARHSHMLAHNDMHTLQTRAHALTHLHADMLTHTHVFVHTLTHTRSLTYPPAHTCVCSSSHTHSHAHTHTHTLARHRMHTVTRAHTLGRTKHALTHRLACTRSHRRAHTALRGHTFKLTHAHTRT